MILEYTMSGIAHTRITYKNSVYENPRVLAAIKEILSKCQNRNGHRLSLLYNAFAEAGIGENFWHHYKDNLENIYSDSGGLQVVTTGAVLTDKLKNKIYTSQASHSSIAMSFDEIPVRVDGKSKIGDISNRTFDKEIFEESAIKSAKNLEEQIDFFIDKKTSCKPLMIVQGNGLDYFCRWVDIMLKNIPQEKHEYISGLSISGASIGSGPLEDIERLFSYHKIEAPDHIKKHLHLLGVGSISRLLPVSALLLSKVYPEDIRLSYDSTTHSGNITRGKFLAEDCRHIQYGRYDKQLMLDVKKRVEELFPGYIENIQDEMFFDILTVPREELFEKYSNIEYEYHVTFCLLAVSMVDIFTKFFHRSCTSKKFYTNQCLDRKVPHLVSFLEVKNLDDYNHWIRQVGKYVKSSRIIDQTDKSSLEGFF